MNILSSDDNAKNSNVTSITIFTNPTFGELKTIIINGEIWFVGKEVAIALGYSNTSDALSRHVKEKDRILVKLSDIQPDRDSRLTDNLKNVKVTLINESGLYTLILKSALPSAEKFQDWVTSEVLPSIRKTGEYRMVNTEKEDWPAVNSKVNIVFNIVSRAKELLKFDDSSTLSLLQKYLPAAGVPENMIALPDYTDSKGVHKAPTTLIKQFGYDIKTPQFNLLLLDNGYLERVPRPSTSSPTGEKLFWHLTEKGLEFGINKVSPKNPDETQPHYYEKKFEELMGILGVNKKEK